MDRIQLLLIVLSIIFIIFIFELNRNRKLSVQYSIIWFFAGLLLLIFSIFRHLFEKIAYFLGIHYAPSLIFPIVIFVILIIGIHFSIIISKLSYENKILTQELGILKNKIEEIENNLNEK